MPRLFTLQQAERLLPEVERAIREAIRLQAEYQEAEEEWRKITHHITLQGGVVVDHYHLIEQKNRRESRAQAFKNSIEEIHDYGCLIKDLDIGLIDFPTLFRGTEVYLCWKLGETGIHFWHGVDEGFRGRKPIDQDFLDHHQGERTN
jgi:hypothetical protein